MSSYNIYVGLNRRGDGDFVRRFSKTIELRDLIDGVNIIDEGEPVFPAGLYQKAKEKFERDYDANRDDGFIIRISGTYGCRESVTYAISRIMQSIHVVTYMYGSPVIYIVLNDKIQHPNQELLEKLNVKIFHSRQFGLSFFGDKTVLSFDTIGRRGCKMNYQLLSLFLYMFRNANLLEDVVNSDVGDVDEMLFYLSREFLKHPDWGDNFNSHLGLSMFCYCYSHSLNIDNTESGPVHTVFQGITASQLLSYLQHCHITTLPDRKRYTESEAYCKYNAAFLVTFNKLLFYVRKEAGLDVNS